MSVCLGCDARSFTCLVVMLVLSLVLHFSIELQGYVTVVYRFNGYNLRILDLDPLTRRVFVYPDSIVGATIRSRPRIGQELEPTTCAPKHMCILEWSERGVRMLTMKWKVVKERKMQKGGGEEEKLTFRQLRKQGIRNLDLENESSQHMFQCIKLKQRILELFQNLSNVNGQNNELELKNVLLVFFNTKFCYAFFQSQRLTFTWNTSFWQGLSLPSMKIIASFSSFPSSTQGFSE